MSLYRTRLFSALLGLAAAFVLVFSANPATSLTWPFGKKKCVRIYYDRSKTPDSYWIGRTYAMFTQNLLGHFPEWQQIVSPIELYQVGEIETCEATIYLGSYFENTIPKAFFDDFAKTKRRVAWAGYSIWQYSPAELSRLFGHQYSGLTTLELGKTDAEGRPAFFRDVIYKGETFPKFGDFVKLDPSVWQSESEFRAGYEQVKLVPSQNFADRKGAKVLAETRHSLTAEKIPYVVQKDNRFYFADVPFSYMHESDRMLVFADLLFDILDEKPRHNGRYAVVRIEDIHPMIPLFEMDDILRVLREEKVPVTISLIPLFFDPLFRADRPQGEELVTMDRHVGFMDMIRQLQKEKATFIWHGVTHQYGRQQNPHDGVSGSDFEFWDAINNRPVQEDSAAWALDRLEDGWFTLLKAGIHPTIWLTPHYQASTVNYGVFAKVFPWNVGRVIYYNHRLEGAKLGIPERDLWFDPKRPGNSKNRFDALGGLKATVEFDRWNGQIFPYEIYGDVHGQRLIPENLGNSQPFISTHVVRTRSVKEIIADAKRNLVLRDAWASLFYHSFLVGTIESGGRGGFPGDPSELRYIVREIKKLGYHFINLEDWTRKNTGPIRPEPIVRDTLDIKTRGN